MIGIATTIARVTGPQWTRSSSRSTNRPSENRVRISASSTRSTIVRSLASTETTSVAGQHDPERHREHRDRQHRAPHQSRQRRRDGEQRPDDQQGIPEPDLHAAAYIRFSGPPGGPVPVHVAAAGRRLSGNPALRLAGDRAARPGRAGGDRAEVGHRLRAQQAARERRALDADREPDRAARWRTASSPTG